MKYLKILLGLTVGVVWLQTSMASEKKLEIIKKGDKGTKYKLFKLTSSQKELAKLERTPKLIWVKIVSALSKKDLLNLSCTSKTLYNKAKLHKIFYPSRIQS